MTHGGSKKTKRKRGFQRDGKVGRETLAAWVARLTRRPLGGNGAGRSVLPKHTPVTPAGAGPRPRSVPVAAVRGPRRNPVDADVRLHTQHRLVLQLGCHLGSDSAAGAGYGRGRAELPTASAASLPLGCGSGLRLWAASVDRVLLKPGHTGAPGSPS